MKPSKPKKKQPKNKPSADDVAVVARIRGVRAHRAPYLKLFKQTAEQALQQFLPANANSILEIGTGDGQLREILPTAVLPNVIHTEPLKLAIREFEKHHPGVAIQRASAEVLPASDASIDAVLGLAVLDVVEDGAAVACEIHRVLRPGGVFIHFLDMSTVLSGMFQLLAQGNWVVLPNVVSDPSAARFPEDLLLIPLPQLQLVLQVLVANRHPYAKPLRQYLELWAARPLAVRTATQEFNRLAEDATLRAVLKNLFKVAYDLAPPAQRQAFSSFQGQPAASSKFFEGRLREWFAASQGYSVLFSDVQARFEVVPSRADWPYHYSSLSVGEHRKLSHLPKVLLCEAAPPPPPDHSLLELGVFVFAAQKAQL
ncbi:MAG TPA: class I SAM-dependent methyltransferase [Polyangiaceae bacterium]|nr:class I SAM-dependent methyltransferase [Polyangiaceae bacterium]